MDACLLSYVPWAITDAQPSCKCMRAYRDKAEIVADFKHQPHIDCVGPERAQRSHNGLFPS